MISKERLGDSLVIAGLLIAVFLGFETLSGEFIQISGGVTLDLTYIIALTDAPIIYIGLTFHSKKVSANYAETEDKSVINPLQIAIAFFVLFLFCSYILLSAIPSVPWSTVYWFDPPLNFQLIRDHFKVNLFISQLLVLVLVVLLAGKRFEPKLEPKKDKET